MLNYSFLQKTAWLFLAAAAILYNNTASAQLQFLPGAASTHARVLHRLLSRNGQSGTAAKPAETITTERVSSISLRENMFGSMQDSVHFRYNPSDCGMRSVYDYNTMLYPYNYPYSTSPMFTYAGVFTDPQVRFDTMQHWQVNPNTLEYGYYESGYASYGTTGRMTGYTNFFADSAVYPNMRYANQFNAGDNIAISTGLILDEGISDSLTRQYFAYNTTGRLTADSIYVLHLGVWRKASVTYYTYSTDGDPIQIEQYANVTDTSYLLPLELQLRYTSTYDPTHRLLTVRADYHNGTSVKPYVRDTFEYTGSLPFHTSWRQHQWDAINLVWTPQFNMTKHITGTRPDTVLIQSYNTVMGGWEPKTRQVISYNTALNPDTLWQYEHNFFEFPATPDFTTIYRYETCTETVSVKEQQTKQHLRLFPNPAGDILQLTGYDNSKTATALVRSMTGQLLSRQQLNSSTFSISLAALPAGNYLVTIMGAEGDKLHSEVIIKH